MQINLPRSCNKREAFFVLCSTVQMYTPYGFMKLDALNTRYFLCDISVMLSLRKVKSRLLPRVLESTPQVSTALPSAVTSTDNVKFRNPINKEITV